MRRWPARQPAPSVPRTLQTLLSPCAFSSPRAAAARGRLAGHPTGGGGVEIRRVRRMHTATKPKQAPAPGRGVRVCNVCGPPTMARARTTPLNPTPPPPNKIKQNTYRHKPLSGSKRVRHHRRVNLRILGVHLRQLACVVCVCHPKKLVCCLCRVFFVTARRQPQPTQSTHTRAPPCPCHAPWCGVPPPPRPPTWGRRCGPALWACAPPCLARTAASGGR